MKKKEVSLSAFIKAELLDINSGFSIFTQVFKEDVKQLNEKYQNLILNQINQFNIAQGEINELQQVCNRLFTQFSKKQAELIENESISNFAIIIFNITGVQIDIQTKQALGFISSSTGLLATSAVYGSAAQTILTVAQLAVYGSLGLAGVGLCVLGVGLMMCHREKILNKFQTDELATINSKIYSFKIQNSKNILVDRKQKSKYKRNSISKMIPRVLRIYKQL